jgi:Uma2 family endonuclease
MSAVIAGERLTVHDLDCVPDRLDDTRHELIDGVLHVASQPSLEHQITCHKIQMLLGGWTERTGLGSVVPAPGVIFSPTDAVAPDVVWISRERLPRAVGEDGKLHLAPDLMVEVLSPGAQNTKRDRELKLVLYSRYGVGEYWIVDWQVGQVTVYRRENDALQLEATLYAEDTLASPLLPGFSCRVGELFSDLP